MGNVKALILAAGKGVRMNSERPKVLLEVNGLPLLWYPVCAAKAAGAEEVLVVVGAGREEVQEAFTDDGLTFVIQQEQRGTGHAVISAREALSGFDGYVLVLCGDSPFIESDTLERLVSHTERTGAACTILTSILDDPAGYGRIVRGEMGVREIVEEKCADEAQKAIREINSGTYCFRWRDLDGVLDGLRDENPQGEYLLTDAIGLLIARGSRVEAVVSGDPQEGLGVNTRAQQADASKILRRKVLDRLMAEGVTVVDPVSAFIDPRAEIGPDTVINPFVVIEGPVKIGARCRIGPFTRIRGATRLGEGVHLGNFVEVTRSAVSEGSRALHLAFVGDATVGGDVNIAAGVITANFDGNAHRVTEIGDGASVGAGTVLVAPCRVAAGGRTGAGAVLTRGKTVPSGEIWVGVPAKELVRDGHTNG
ncbi:MAG: NTP transferase domain-containing protein [Planctomycetes bacterium]|nr:NTP transferase domain-containing protein [Planctomycetota bacterium]